MFAIAVVGSATGCGAPWLYGFVDRGGGVGGGLPGCASGANWYDEETCAGVPASEAGPRLVQGPYVAEDCVGGSGRCESCRMGGRGPIAGAGGLRQGIPGGRMLDRFRERLLAASQEPLVPNPTPPPPARFHPVPTRPVFEPCETVVLPAVTYEPLPSPAK